MNREEAEGAIRELLRVVEYRVAARAATLKTPVLGIHIELSSLTLEFHVGEKPSAPAPPRPGTPEEAQLQRFLRGYMNQVERGLRAGLEFGLLQPEMFERWTWRSMALVHEEVDRVEQFFLEKAQEVREHPDRPKPD